MTAECHPWKICNLLYASGKKKPRCLSRTENHTGRMSPNLWVRSSMHINRLYMKRESKLGERKEKIHDYYPAHNS